MKPLCIHPAHDSTPRYGVLEIVRKNKDKLQNKILRTDVRKIQNVVRMSYFYKIKI